MENRSLTWTYRIIDHGELFALHRVALGEDGAPVDWVRRSIDFACDLDCGPQGVISSLEEALAEAKGHPVLKDVDGRLTEAATH